MPRKAKDIAADIDAILAHADAQAAEVAEPVLDDVPPYMLTREQWAKRWGCARTTAGEKLRRLIETKGWQERAYRIAKGSRKQYPVPHYGPGVG